MTQDRTVLIVGATGRAAAHSAHRAGLFPRVADRFADADLVSLCPVVRIDDRPTGYLDWLQTSPQAGWIYTGPLENHPDWVDRLERCRPLWGNRGQVLRRVRDPSLLQSTLSEAGLPTLRVERELRALPKDGSWLCKPVRSAGGGLVTVVDDQFTIPAHEVYYQQRIRGQDVSACYLAAKGEAVLLGVTRQLIGAAWAGARGFQYVGSLGPCPWRSEVSDAATRLGQTIAAAFGLTGLFGVDAVLCDGELYCLEVNPRYTASVEVIERACGFPTLGWHIDACRSGARPQPSPNGQVGAVAGKAVLYARQETHFTPAVQAWSLSCRDADGWPGVADVPIAGSRILPGQPIATLLATGDQISSVEQVLKQRARELAARVLECCHRWQVSGGATVAGQSDLRKSSKADTSPRSGTA